MSTGAHLAVALLAGVLTGAAAWCVGAALRPRSPRTRPRVTVDSTMLVIAILAGLVVLLITRWPMAALATVALVMMWPRLFAGAAANRDRRRLDAIAKWLEDLRDLQAGSNLDLLESLSESARRAPAGIEPELARLASRLGHHTPIGEALMLLADELDHPVADTAVAAMTFAAGHASGSTLNDTFAQLAVTAREELVARDRIDRLRAGFERSMRRMIAILAGILAYLAVIARDLLEPYRTATGQVWLVVPLGIWAASLLWLRGLSRYERTGRIIDRSALGSAAQ